MTNAISMYDFSRAVFNYQREVIGYLDDENNFVELDEHDSVEIPLETINSIIRFVPDGLFSENFQKQRQHKRNQFITNKL